MTSRLTDSFRCGIAAEVLQLPGDCPIAGYGGLPRRVIPFRLQLRRPVLNFFRTAEGILDPIRAKAMALIDGDRRLLFISLDVVAVPPDLHDAIVRAVAPLGFSRDTVVISATHTHSGPGGVTHSWLWTLVVMDAFRRQAHDAVVSGALAAARRALAEAEPASLSTVTFSANGLQRSRQHDRWFFDPSVNVLLARSTATNRWFGAMVNMAIHGTALQGDNLRFSADVPGAIERSLERELKAPALFVNGAVGDVSPLLAGTDGLTHVEQAIGEQFRAALPWAHGVTPQWSLRRQRVLLPRPRVAHHVPAGMVLPREIDIAVIRLGDTVMLTWPGEPTTTLGLAAKGVATDAGFGRAWILGLTNGYFGYFVAPDEYRSGGYGPAKSLFGPTAGIDVVNAFRLLMADV